MELSRLIALASPLVELLLEIGSRVTATAFDRRRFVTLDLRCLSAS